jgi:hypothetical protein
VPALDRSTRRDAREQQVRYVGACGEQHHAGEKHEHAQTGPGLVLQPLNAATRRRKNHVLPGDLYRALSPAPIILAEVRASRTHRRPLRTTTGFEDREDHRNLSTSAVGSNRGFLLIAYYANR